MEQEREGKRVQPGQLYKWIQTKRVVCIYPDRTESENCGGLPSSTSMTSVPRGGTCCWGLTALLEGRFVPPCQFWYLKPVTFWPNSRTDWFISGHIILLQSPLLQQGRACVAQTSMGFISTHRRGNWRHDGGHSRGKGHTCNNWQRERT